MASKNLEQTLDWLVSNAKSGIIIDKWLTFDQLSKYLTRENLGKYYLVAIEGQQHDNLYVITARDNGGLMAVNLGQFPVKGPQGVPGVEGPKPVISISNNNTWVIDGVDTGKPTALRGDRGPQGIKGNSGKGIDNLYEMTSLGYTPTVELDGDYYDISTTAVFNYDGGTKVSNFKYKVPKDNTKLNKKTTEGSKVYAHIGNDQTEITYDTAANANTIAYRTTNGRLKVGTPYYNDEATTKKYVDDAIAAIPSGGGGSQLYLHVLENSDGLDPCGVITYREPSYLNGELSTSSWAAAIAQDGLAIKTCQYMYNAYSNPFDPGNIWKAIIINPYGSYGYAAGAIDINSNGEPVFNPIDEYFAITQDTVYKINDDGTITSV